MKKGIWFAVGAYTCWGLFPLYWKLLHEVPAMQVIGHRIVWSFLSIIAVVLMIRQWKLFRDSAFRWRVFGIYMIASMLIGINWLMYVWAVNNGHIVETSLGYFINPLLSVLMGVLFFREKMRTWQWICIGLAFSGVLYLTIAFGSPPWIALTLAFSFALYGLVKKIAPLGALHGLLFETSLLTLPAIAYLYIENQAGSGAFLHSSLLINLLLIGAGFVTTLPLLMFASAAQRIPLSLVGILQFIAPTLQFLVGVLIYHEAFTQKQFHGYGLVWAALILYCAEGYWMFRKQVAGK